MNIRLQLSVLFLCLAFATQSYCQQTNTLPAAALHPVGRYLFNNRQQLELISSAVHFGFGFQGRECQVYVSLPDTQAHSYLQYEVDGVYQKRIRINGNSSQPVVIQAPKAGTHTVWIYKTTEAHTGAVVIDKITGRNIRALEIPARPLIEFIGNSITCGAAADTSAMACGVGAYHDHHNAYYAYGPRVARALEADYMLSSVSGIGAYRNWNSNGPAMPQVYENTDLQADSHIPWNFGLFVPQVVSIALGTNDFSNGDGKKPRLPFDSAAFVSAYSDFVEKVGRHYPAAQIALLSSPMVQGSQAALFERCLLAVKQQADALHPADKPVAVFFFKPMKAHGCSGHPSVEEHAVMADELLPFFKNLLPPSRQ